MCLLTLCMRHCAMGPRWLRWAGQASAVFQSLRVTRYRSTHKINTHNPRPSFARTYITLKMLLALLMHSLLYYRRTNYRKKLKITQSPKKITSQEVRCHSLQWTFSCFTVVKIDTIKLQRFKTDLMSRLWKTSLNIQTSTIKPKCDKC